MMTPITRGAMRLQPVIQILPPVTKGDVCYGRMIIDVDGRRLQLIAEADHELVRMAYDFATRYIETGELPSSVSGYEVDCCDPADFEVGNIFEDGMNLVKKGLETATAPLQAVADIAHGENVWDSIYKAGDKALESVDALRKSPVFQVIVKVAPYVPIPIVQGIGKGAEAYDKAREAGRLVAAVARGDQGASQRLIDLCKQASQGDASAAKSWNTVQAAISGAKMLSKAKDAGNAGKPLTMADTIAMGMVDEKVRREAEKTRDSLQATLKRAGLAG